MLWQYRTIVFEFSKDGLLGDKYLDDEEIEKTLNEQGAEEWELVNVAMIQEGLLAVLKRPRQDRRRLTGDVQVIRQSSEEGSSSEVNNITAQQIQEEEREHIRLLEEQRKQTMEKREQDMVGEIKIS